jgi:hypothetical protein
MDKLITFLIVVAAAITFWSVTTANHLYVG